MVGWAADHFGNEVGEALMEGLPIRVGCHNWKEDAKCILICRWYGLRVAVALQGETGIGFIPLCWRWSSGPCVCWANALPLSHTPAPKWLPIGRPRLKWSEMQRCGTPEYEGPFSSAFADWHPSQARGTDRMALSSSEFLGTCEAAWSSSSLRLENNETLKTQGGLRTWQGQ